MAKGDKTKTKKIGIQPSKASKNVVVTPEVVAKPGDRLTDVKLSPSYKVALPAELSLLKESGIPLYYRPLIF